MSVEGFVLQPDMAHDDDSLFLSRRTFMQASAATALATQATLARAAPRGATTTAAGYITQRLSRHGAKFLFGVPGATCDPLFAAAARRDSGMEVAITASDLEAGYAADGYARMAGLSALAVTYGVGTMSLIGVIGGAYAERSPIVVFNGGPHRTDLRLQREFDTYFSHSNGKERCDLNMFREVTARAARAESAEDVPAVVDAAIETALVERRPVYVEIPKNIWGAKVAAPAGSLRTGPSPSGKEQELAQAALKKLRRAKKPALVLGVELSRYGLSQKAEQLVQKLGIPYATTMLGKSTIPESNRHFAGVYAGVRSVPAIRGLLEEADALLCLGCVWGRQYRRLATRQVTAMTQAAQGRVRVGKQKQGTVAALPALLDAMLAESYQPNAAQAANNPLRGRTFADRRRSLKKKAPVRKEPGLTYDEVMQTVSDSVQKDHVVITDTSLSMYPAADLEIDGRNAFVCNGVWQSIGFSVGAASGVALGSGRRPLVICGDGGFQMTAQSLSTLARKRLPATVIVLDNGHYGIEQFLLDKRFFADKSAPGIAYLGLNRWDYPLFARAVGIQHASAVDTAAGLQKALAATRGRAGPTFIAARIKPHDVPAQLSS